jgi:alpha-tubulin suppressor-like RCC1 family protein
MSLTYAPLIALLLGCGRIDFNPDRGCVAQLTSNGDQTCVRRTDGQVLCWGDNTSGNLGNGSSVTSSAVPVFAAVDDAITIASGEETTCAIRADRTLVCWGGGQFGNIGDGATVDRPLPVPIELPAGVVEVALADTHTCARLSDGTGRCWGSNAFGELASSVLGTEPQPIDAPIGAVTSLVLGDNMTCAIDVSGRAACWGRNDAGELGDGTVTSRPDPAAVAIPDPIIQIAAGCHRHNCAVTDRGEVWCWGENSAGEIGNGTIGTIEAMPVRTEITGAVEVAVGAFHTCARTAADEVFCWGRNVEGELGDGTLQDSPVPVRVVDVDGRLSSLQMSCIASYVLRDDGTFLAWGSALSMGTGQITDQLTPIEVPISCDRM